MIDESHQDISERKLRKLEKSPERDESVLHLAHAQLNFFAVADSTLQLQLYTSLRQTRVAFYDCEEQQTPATEIVNFIVFEGFTTE